MSETKIQPEPFIPEDGMYAHDLPTDYDAAIDRHEITGETSAFNQPDASEPTHITDIHEDDVHEKPSPLFHNAGLYDEAEGTGGSHYDEATGENYKGHKSEEELAQDIYGGHIALEHTVEQDATDAWLAAVSEDPSKRDEATAKWQQIVNANTGPQARQQASEQWIEDRKRQQ